MSSYSYSLLQNQWRDRSYRCDNNRFKFFDLIRPFQRFITGKLRLTLFISILVFMLIYTVKTLKPSSDLNQNIIFSNDFDENLINLRHEMQYAVMIDAGSSGSRVHIYVWPPHSGDRRQLLQIRMLHNQLGKDVFANINPGLSSCASDPSTASDYITPLLNYAADNIPVEKHKETPLFILATAGMRLLPQQTQDAIIDDLIRDVPKNFSFLFPPNHVQVITGKEEGIFSWIAINYLMGRFDHSIETGPKTTVEFDKNKVTRAQSISMLEMGGASVQIAFEITSKSQYEELLKRYPKEVMNNLISEFNLGCSGHDTEHNYRLFVTTYLGLGANVARSTYVNSLISSTINYNTDNTSLSIKETKLFDPCLPIDSTETVNITRRTKNNNGSTTFVYTLKGSGDFPLCQTKLKQVLDPIHESSRQCSANLSCPLTQLRQTSAPFDNSEFYGFSEFWYTTEDLLRMGGPYSYAKFSESASGYCSTSWSVILDRFKRKLYRNADHRRLLYQCFKSAWITSVLHDGFKMPRSYTKYKSASTVNHEQVQWTLGALLYRTRFFPLRDIEQQFSGINYSKVNLTSTPYYVNYTLFILCMVAVLLCILIYLRHLHKMVNNNNNNNNSNNFDETKLSHNQTNYDDHLVLIDIPPEKESLIESLR